jgi:DNA repair protein RadC
LNYEIEIKKRTIKDWRDDEKPREKLASYGSKYLSDAELLAIVLREGSRNHTALDVARSLLNRFGDISEMAKADYSEFKGVKSIGEAKSILLAAIFEISKRIKSEQFLDKKKIMTPADIAPYYISKFFGARHESFVVLLLNSANRAFREVIVSEGILNASLVHPREAFRLAITESAASVIFVHNHPSGNSEPSDSDIEITKQLVEAGKILDIAVIDHLIVANDNYTSLSDKGFI